MGRTDEARQLAITALEQSGQRQAELEYESVLESFVTIREWLVTMVEPSAE
jgi:hypothetical protein